MKDADAASAPPLRAAEAIALAGVVLLFFLLRIPILHGEGLLLGWNSDAAIFGLMAKAIAEGRDLPVFFWGQSYMGPLTSYLAAGVGSLIGHVGPLALRMAVAIEVIAAIVFYWLGLRRGFGRGAALLAALWLAIGPAFLFRFVSAPIGAEQVFVIGGAIFWFAARTELRRVRDWFVFGLLVGLGWWINQGIVFAAGAAVTVAVTGPRVWSTLRDAIRFTARVAIRPERLGWREPDRATLVLLRAIQVVLIVFLVLGVLRAGQFRVPAFFLFEPVQEPVIAIAVYNVVLEFLFGTRLREWLLRSRWLPQAIAAAAGAAIGYAPVVIGGITGAYPKSYGFSAPFATVPSIPGRFADTFRSDVWHLVGGEWSPWGAMVVLPLLATLGRRCQVLLVAWADSGNTGNKQDLTPSTVRGMAGVTIVLCAVFYLFSSRAHPGAMRYVVSALPMIYAYAGEELLRWRRGAAVALAILVTAGLAVPRVQQVRDVAAARAEAYSVFAGAFDPRPVVREIESRGYRVCYADYWVAYKLEWVSDRRVRFIPYRGYDRRRDESRRLAAERGPKCHVSNEGTVSDFGERPAGYSRPPR